MVQRPQNCVGRGARLNGLQGLPPARVFGMAHVLWQPAPCFVEAATALAVAHLAVDPDRVCAGAVQLMAIAVLALVLSRVGRLAQAYRPVQVAASILMVFGMVWFFLRLRS